MEADSARPLDDLLGQRGWVLALARSLVADPAAAEDVAQETWLAAVRRPPEPGRSPRPWLARVVRNFAHQRLRSEAARAGRERGAAVGEELPPTDELLSRLETQRALAEALAALDEPYRTTLLRRYFDELSSAEIARREGLPPATVRSRLQRGLELLRTRLEARYGDRRNLGLALGALLGPDGRVGVAAGTASALSGALVMNLAWKSAAAAALLVTTGVFLMTRDAALPAAPRASVAVPPELVAPAPPAAQVALSAPTGAVERAAATAPDEAASLPAAGTDEEARGLASARVDGRAVDEFARPLRGALLRSLDDGLEVSTGADGGFALELDLGAAHERTKFFALSCAGRGTRFPGARLLRGETTHLGDVVLAPGGWVSGRVLAPDGRPAAGARVLVTEPELPWDRGAAQRLGPHLLVPTPEGLTDALGRFRIDGVSPGFARVWAVAEGTRHAFSEPQRIEPGAGAEGLELALEALTDGDRIAGRVLDPQGRGVTAELRVSYKAPNVSGTWTQRSEADGSFTLGLPALVPFDLVARAPEDRWGNQSLRGVLPGTLDVVLRFEERAALPLAVESSSGRPLEACAITLLDARDEAFVLDYGGGEQAEAPHEVRVPNVPFKVRAAARGHAAATSAPLDPEALPARLELTLASVPGLRGVVVDEHGQPVPGARVELRSAYDGRDRVWVNGFRLAHAVQASASDTSDEQGAFYLTLVADGAYVVLAEKQGRPAAVTPVLALSQAVGAAGVEVDWLPAGAIAGRVRVDPGVDPAGTIVAVHRGDGAPRTQRVGADGAYRFEGLGAGRWQVLRIEAELDPNRTLNSLDHTPDPQPFEWHCSVQAGETTWHDLDLRSRQECRLQGSFVLDGQPAGKVWWVRLERVGPGSFEPPSTSLDQHGRFHLSAPEPGAYRVVLTTPEGSGLTTVKHPLQLAFGPNTWALELETGALSGENAPTAAGSESGLLYAWSDGPRAVSWEVLLEPDESGRFELPFVPAGSGQLRSWTDSGGEPRWNDLLTVEIEPGQTAHIVIP